ncbi:MAG: YafY family transcriptional regulator [Clostridiales bacterium]|nr:YafY family transcriptional regulator [Clostridiales bacterium]
MRIDRLVNILYILINKERVTIKELSEKLEVSRRTIFRDLDTLNLAGIPIISYPGLGGGVGIMDGFKIDKSVLSEQDFSTILSGLNSIKSLGDDKKIEYIIEKLIPQSKITHIHDTDIIIDLSSWFSNSDTHEIIYDLRRAISAFSCIRIAYHSNKGFSRRIIEPYKLIFKCEDWYLYAYCTTKKDFRLFKLNRISSYEILDKEFAPRELDEAAMKFQMPMQHHQVLDTCITVVLEYELCDKEFLIDKLGAQNFVDDNGKGTIEVSVSDLEWATNLVLSLQNKVKVISPLELQNEVISRIATMMGRYDNHLGKGEN